MIDNFCSRRFWIDTADATRYYTATSSGLILIDDLATVTTVATDVDSAGTFTESLVENTDYYFEPLNAAADGVARTRLIVHPKSSFVDFPYQRRAVRVVGKFGWPTVPIPIQQAASIQASKLLRRAREAPFGIVTLGIDQGVAMRISQLDPDVAALITPYAKAFFA